ncbi:MAG: RIFT barrel domain-containing protein [Armatimonadota bacterium]
MRKLLIPLLIPLLVTAHASAAPRLLLFDGAEGTTARALKALEVPYTVAAPADYASPRVSLFDHQIVVWGMDNDQAKLASDPQPLLQFVRAGGVFLSMRMQQDCSWTPVPLKMDKAYALGEIVKPDHAVFTRPNAMNKQAFAKVHGGSIYRAFHAPGEGWIPLVSTGEEQNWDKTPALSTGPHYGLVELPYGKGRIILCQMIPEYGFINDDKGQPGTSRQFMENIVAYATASAPKWPTPKPRVVPANFYRDLSVILRQPTAQGTLPLADSAWKASTQGAYACKTDRRGLLTMSHADRPATAGSFAEVSRTVAIPGGAGVSPEKSPVFLRFYNSDDYCGGMEPKMVGDARVSSTENRIKDTRFKQVLVNGKVVWEEDALGLNPIPATRRFHLVDISKALGNAKAATVTLRVEDRQPTPEDKPFATDVYWASVDVLPGIVQAPLKQSKVTFSGAKGRYAVLVRALDEHAGRAKLQVSVDGKPLGGAQLTADDYCSYWINAGLADLKPGSVVGVKATPDGEEAGAVEAVAFVPVGLVDVGGLSRARKDRAQGSAPTGGASPLYKLGKLVTRATFPVLVSGPEAYKPQGEVVSGGMPFAYGAVKSENNLRLLNDQNREVPMQTRVLANWPDGSLKWVLFSYPTAPGAVRCEYGTAVRREPAKFLTVTQDDQIISINTGQLQAKISKISGDLISELSVDGKIIKPATKVWNLVAATQDGKVFLSGLGKPTRCELIDAGPVRTTVRRVGRLQAEDGSTLLEYDVLLTFDMNSGVVRVQPTITHKEASADEKLKLVSLTAPLALSGEKRPQPWVDVDGTWQQAGPEIGVLQNDDKQGSICAGEVSGAAEKLLGDPTKRKSGFVRLVGDGVSADFIPRWFWQMYPRGISAVQNGYQTMILSGDPYTLYQGQAIWNDFALRFSDDTAQPRTEDFEAIANPAVALAEPSYTASTLALCQFMPENQAVFPEYEETVEACYTAYMNKREARREYGVQNFGDDTFEWGYGPSYTFWSNQEYDHHYGMLLQFLRSGDWRWWEIGDQGARHNRDVDCYHWAPGREHLIGAPHHHNAKHIVEKGWYPDHTVSGSSPSHAWVEGLIAHYFLTGDQRTLETVNGMGDWFVWCVNNNQYGAGGQERGPGWTLVALSALYNATGEKKYLDAGNKVMDWLRSVQDPVRGVVSIPISEQPSYEGGSAFMHGIVARGAGRWYEASGDPRGKLAVVGIADWLTSEAMGPPAFFYYKQAPRIKGGYGISEWQCISALTYAMKYADSGWYGPLAEAHFRSGRAGERSMAWVPQALAQLQERFHPYRASWSATQVIVAPDTPAQMKLSLGSASDKPLTVTLKLKSAPAGVSVALPAKPLTIAPNATAETLVNVTLNKLETGSGRLQLEAICGSDRRLLELPVIAVPVLVRIEKTAAEGQLQAPFVLDKDKAAVAPRDASFTGNPRQQGERAGWVAWEVDLPMAGTYLLTADCSWLDDKGNSLFLQIDDGPEITFGNDGDMGRWHQVRAPEPLKLSAGRHTIRLINREDGGRVRRMAITNIM